MGRIGFVLWIALAVAGCSLIPQGDLQAVNNCIEKKPIKCAASLIYIKHTWKF